MTPPDPGTRLRWGAGVVILLLIVVVVLVDVFGRLFIRDTFNISDVMLGTLGGMLLLIIGIPLARGHWPFDGGEGGPKP
jgi:glycopeptide antibiotics resistance protein